MSNNDDNNHDGLRDSWTHEFIIIVKHYTTLHDHDHDHDDDDYDDDDDQRIILE